jgi:hypothetical protein
LEVVVFRSLVRITCLIGSLASLTALSLGAQEKSTRETKAASSVPESAQPPAGLCRVWLENVPASQQPAPTDCATAIKSRPNNAHVLFGSLRDDETKPLQKGSPASSAQRSNPWPNRLGEPRHPTDVTGGVRAVNSTTIIRRPTPDSGPKRRP